jgi:hypothetical protein
MGKVYRAHDSRLNRDVAIKVSNAQLTESFTYQARAMDRQPRRPPIVKVESVD